MQVIFYGTYRLITGAKLYTVETVPGGAIRDLLQAVAARFPALRDEMFDKCGALYPYIPLYLNGRNPRLLEGGLNAPVRQDDVLSIFSPISSGRINVEEINQTLND